MNRPTLHDAGLLVDAGRVAAVGPWRDFGGSHTDLGDVLVTPGLVNAHTHLELSDRERGEPPAGFALGKHHEWRPAEAAAAGAAECLRFGVTTVGDVSQFHAETRPVLRRSPLKAVSYAEVLGLGKARPRADALLAAALEDVEEAGGVTPGLTPHAPYTVDRGTLEKVLAAAGPMPVAMHLAESPEEAQFVRTAAGPMREIWQRLGGWTDDAFAPFDGSPVAWAASAGLLDRPVTLAHMNYPQSGDLNLLARPGVLVAYCPRTHGWFGHVRHPMEEMQAAGLAVCLATDSRATSPNLDLIAEARRVLVDRPHLDSALLWDMVTRVPGRWIGGGTFAPGSTADFVCWPTTAADPLRDVLQRDVIPTAVYVAGEAVDA